MAATRQLRLLALPLLVANLHARAEETSQAAALQSVVVGTTILPGQGTPLNQVPANVQTLQGGAVTSPRAATLAQALDQGVGSVNVNDTAGNPYQLDVNFAASPPRPRWARRKGCRCSSTACASTRSSATPSTGT